MPNVLLSRNNYVIFENPSIRHFLKNSKEYSSIIHVTLLVTAVDRGIKKYTQYEVRERNWRKRCGSRTIYEDLNAVLKFLFSNIFDNSFFIPYIF